MQDPAGPFILALGMTIISISFSTISVKKKLMIKAKRQENENKRAIGSARETARESSRQGSYAFGGFEHSKTRVYEK